MARHNRKRKLLKLTIIMPKLS